MHTMDTTGVNEAGDFSPALAQVCRMKVIKAVEGKSKKGDYMVTSDVVISSGQYAGKEIRYHNVTFLAPDSKGAGFAKHWLRVLGQPYEGKISINPPNWIGKEFIGRIAIDSYDKDGQTRYKNVLDTGATWAIDDADRPDLGIIQEVAKPLENGKVKEEFEVPF